MKSRVPWKIAIREYMESILVAVIVALFLRAFVISAYKIPTGSMSPTLKVGDFIFAYKLSYGWPVPFVKGARLGKSHPSRGDVVVFRYPGNEKVNYVKRVVGLPGDQIAIKDKVLLINESAAAYQTQENDVIRDIPGHEYYVAYTESFDSSRHLVMQNSTGEEENFGPVVVPPGHVFVLGDNRDSSDDSRYWGAVPMQNLEGRVVMVWLSLDWLNRWGDDRYPSIRWQRLFQAVR